MIRRSPPIDGSCLVLDAGGEEHHGCARIAKSRDYIVTSTSCLTRDQRVEYCIYELVLHLMALESTPTACGKTLPDHPHQA